jgi:hypothetical protein
MSLQFFAFMQSKRGLGFALGFRVPFPLFPSEEILIEQLGPPYRLQDPFALPCPFTNNPPKLFHLDLCGNISEKHLLSKWWDHKRARLWLSAVHLPRHSYKIICCYNCGSATIFILCRTKFHMIRAEVGRAIRGRPLRVHGHENPREV